MNEVGKPGTRRARLVACAVAAVGLVGAYFTGLFEWLLDPARVREGLLDLGPWGYAAFICLYTFTQPFGVPGTIFIFAAPLIWPWPTAFALSMAGTMGASVVGFSFARFVARDWVQKRLPARFRTYDEALERRGFATVFLLRFIFWMPQPLHAFLGLSRVGFGTHFWASLLAYLLPLWAVSYFGERVFTALRELPLWVWASLGGGLLIAATIAWLIRRRIGRGLS